MKNTLIYHITRKDNLPSILACGGLYSSNCIADRDIMFKNSAYANIQDRRSRALVKTPDNGCLHDYIPFYFAPRSPMLFANFKKQVEFGINTQPDIVYLVSKTENVVEHASSFAFTDGHAVMEISRFFTNLDDLKEIDWPLMESQYWNNTKDDNDRKRRRQAEFLVRDFFPFDLIFEIVVYDAARMNFVKSVLTQNNKNKMLHSVHMKPDWYF